MALADNVKKYLQFLSGSVDKAEIEAIFKDDMFATLVKMGGVIMSFEALMILSNLMRGGPGPSARSYFYFALYVLLFSVTAFFVCLMTYLHSRKPQSVTLQINLSLGYSVFLCTWSCILTLLDQQSGTNLNVYSYILMAMAVFFLFKPWQSIALFGGGFVLLNISAFLLQDNPIFFGSPSNVYSLLTNGLFITVLAIITSVTLYRYRIMKKIDRAVIQGQLDQIKEINQKLNDLAMTDQLTGIGNRRFLEEKMHQLQQDAAVHGGLAAGFMLDIDFFKQYNDNYGHQAGDTCLREIADIVHKFAVSEHAFAVRYGGEEFFVCLPGCLDAEGRAEVLRKEIEDQRLVRNDRDCGCVTVSIGVYVVKDLRAIAQDDFLNRCDQALYKAKDSGRNSVCVYLDTHMY